MVHMQAVSKESGLVITETDGLAIECLEEVTVESDSDDDSDLSIGSEEE
jgi:hypothetical protein